MICTRFGNAVVILKAREFTAKVRRVEDGKEYDVNISDLRADSIEELKRELKIATPTSLTEIGF